MGLFNKCQTRLGISEIKHLIDSEENEMQERFQWIDTASNSELVELSGLCETESDKGHVFDNKRFVNKVIIEMLRRILLCVDK